MTKVEFQQAYGLEWKKLMNSEMGMAMLSVSEAESPVRKLFEVSEVNRCNGATVYLNEIAGYERFRTLLEGLGNPPTSVSEPETKFSHEELI